MRDRIQPVAVTLTLGPVQDWLTVEWSSGMTDTSPAADFSADEIAALSLSAAVYAAKAAGKAIDAGGVELAPGTRKAVAQ